MIPTRWHTWACAIGIITLVAISPSARAAATAAGSTDGAWFVATPRLGGAVLVYIDATKAPSGTIVSRFPIAPVALAATDGAVIAAFSAEVAGEGAFRPLRRTAISTDPSGLEVFSRPQVLPPLPSGAPLAGLIVVDSTIVALTVSPAALWACEADQWLQVPLPPGAATAESMWLVLAQGKAGLCAAGARGSATLSTAAPSAADAEWSWSTGRIALPPSTRDVISVSSHLLATHLSEDGDELHIALIRPDDWIDRASIPIGSAPPTIATLGDRILLVTAGEKDPLRTDATIVGLDGSISFQGPVEAASPLSPRDLQLVIFGVMGVVVAAMLFALRADGGTQITLPEDTVIAPPLRRLAATAIDLLPGIAIGIGLASTLDAGADPLEPISTAIAVAFLTTLILAAVPEAIFSRTLGKWALGLRTISVSGERPTWAQALGRTLSKLVFPPIGLLILMHPTVPPPGSCGTIVVMKRPAGDLPPAPPDKP